ncbi:MAG: tRNA threonylcarbamoyladenosine dehydratase, partial [Arcobacter butzleri]|nr:tRNA threonylcarbamoyladenosine dehydratase [Aliarcobacter butzleri]
MLDLKEDRFDRVKKIFGNRFEKLKNSKIIILGVGGVGGVALDALYRSGVQNITIVDYDRFDISNQNRQIGSDRIGEKKVDVLSKLYPNIVALDLKLSKEWVEEFDFSSYDLILDAIDDISVKVALIQKEYKKIISSGGSAKRVDPLKIEYISIWKTYYDKVLRKIKQNRKENGFEK